MKKIDKLVLGAMLGPFFMTFLVVVFILLTQHMLKYFDDIIGKGLGGDVISQLLFYFAIFMTPVALPLAVLLSSLIAFGNLGEHFELTAIKSAGVSLVRTLYPIFFFVLILTGVAFYANNNMVPKAALEAYSLLYDIKQKKPALDLREGAFYNGINDISIKVDKKFPDGITLKDVVVYDHRRNDGNKEVTVADSGKMYTVLNERYLKFELFKGYQYVEGTASTQESGSKKLDNSSMRRAEFDKMQVVFDLSAFQFERTDKKWFQGNRIMRNMNELQQDMDSVKSEVLSQRLAYYQFQDSYFTYLGRTKKIAPWPEEVKKWQVYKDSLTRAEYVQKYDPKTAGINGAGAPDSVTHAAGGPLMRADSTRIPDSLAGSITKPMKSSIARSVPKAKKINRSKRIKTREANTNVVKVEKVVLSDSAKHAQLDSLFAIEPDNTHFTHAANQARQVKQNVANANASRESYLKEYRVFEIQWHKILASSLACVAMFLIGAPLGAIIKKGGLGMPFLVSIFFFILYYVLTMQGEKLAKQGSVDVALGVWMPDIVLFIIGFLFLLQARADARLFEADFYHVMVDRVKSWMSRKKAETVVAMK
jgi:lipopolysaccharide export system permease protein